MRGTEDIKYKPVFCEVWAGKGEKESSFNEEARDAEILSIVVRERTEQKAQLMTAQHGTSSTHREKPPAPSTFIYFLGQRHFQQPFLLYDNQIGPSVLSMRKLWSTFLLCKTLNFTVILSGPASTLYVQASRSAN